MPHATTIPTGRAVRLRAGQALTRGVLATALLILAAACGGGDADPAAEAGRQVRGRVLEVVARNITDVETLRIRAEDGVIWTFVTEGYAGVSPSHLREHQLRGEMVLVSYVRKGDKLVALEITD